MKKIRIPIILLILGLVILILKNKDSTDLIDGLIVALLELFGIIVFLISLGFNIKDCIRRKNKFDFLLVATFLIISIVIWAYNNEKFKSKIIISAHSDYAGFIEELNLRENNQYDFKIYDFKHFYKRHGDYIMNQDTILLNSNGYYDFDTWRFRYSKYLLKTTDRILIPIEKGKLLMDSSRMLRIKN